MEPAPHAEKDEAKALQAETKAQDRERKKAARGKSSGLRETAPSGVPQPAYAMAATGQRPSIKRLGGMLLLLLALIPLEKKIQANQAIK